MLIKNAFSLTETLFVLSIMSLLLLLGSNPKQFKYIDSIEVDALTIYNTQLDALLLKETTSLPFNELVTFNEKGNINQARTIIKDQHKIVFQLGMGRFYYE